MREVYRLWSILVIILLIVVAFFLVYTLVKPKTITPPTPSIEGKTWLKLSPHQCGDSRIPQGLFLDDQVAPLPRRFSASPETENQTEIEFTVYDAIKESNCGDQDCVVCDSCICSAGYTMYIMVDSAVAPKLASMGYSVASEKLSLF